MADSTEQSGVALSVITSGIQMRNEHWRPLLLSKDFLCVCSLFVLCSGCMGWFTTTDPPFQYVLDKGSSESIAEWTAQQTDAWEITNGIDALIYRVQTNRDIRVARHNIELLIPLYDHIESWPEDRILRAGGSDHWTTKCLLSRVLFDAWKNVDFYPISEELFNRLKPSDARKEWLALWERNAAKLQAFQRGEKFQQLD